MNPNFNRDLFEAMLLTKPVTQRFALIKFGGGVVQMSGSIAGDTFARNRYGNYARARTKPTNPNTIHQQRVRSAMNEAVDRWSQVLTGVQRTAWNLYGTSVVMKNRLGENIFLTGFNHYVRSAALYIRNGNPPIDDGPVIFEIPGADPGFNFTASEATQVFTVNYDDTMDWNNEDTGRMFIFQGQPQNAQRNFFAGPWRYMHSVKGEVAAPPASPALANAVFAIAEGQHAWIYARILRADGRISAPFRSDIAVVA